MKKRILVMVLVGSMVLTVSGCGNKEGERIPAMTIEEEENEPTEENVTKEENKLTEENEATEQNGIEDQSEAELSESEMADEDGNEPEIEDRSETEVKEEPVIIEMDWENYFDGLNGAAVVYSPSENSYQIYQYETALARRSPCSTFKIISSLIALETGIIVPDDSTRAWSGEIFWNESWNQDINFEEAFRSSCVWYYREIIDEIGQKVIQEELNKLCYGNCDISDWEGRWNTNNENRALTGFWLESSLKVSPKEQVEVMERIFGEDSNYLEETQDNLKQVMLVSEQEDQDVLIYGKTGMGKSQGVVVDAWFTGFADGTNGRRYFCVYLGETAGEEVSSAKAKEIAIEIVSE